MIISNKDIHSDNFSPRKFYYSKKVVDYFKDKKHIKLEKISLIKSGKTPKNRITGDTLFLKNKNVIENDINIDPRCTEKIDGQGCDILKKNDILLQTTGTIGRTSLYSKEFKSTYNQNIAKIRIFDKMFLPQFVAIFLNSSICKTQISLLYSQTIQKFLSNNSIKKIKIPFVSIKVQKKVVDVYNKMIKHKEKMNLNYKKAIEICDQLFPVSSKKKSHVILKKDEVYSKFLTPRYYINKVNIDEHYELKDIASFETFSEPGSLYYENKKTNRNTSFIRSSDIFDGYFDIFPDFYVITNEDNKKKFGSEIFFTKDGIIGSTFWLPKKFNNIFLQSSIVGVKIINPIYKEILIPLLESKIIQIQFEARTVYASTIPHLQNYHNIKIPIIKNSKILLEIKDYINKFKKSTILYYEKRTQLHNFEF